MFSCSSRSPCLLVAAVAHHAEMHVAVTRMTERELQVLGLLAEGLLATSIASRLRLSPRTVHKHLGNIYRKLGVNKREELIHLIDER